MSLFYRMTLSKRSATFWDHALNAPAPKWVFSSQIATVHCRPSIVLVLVTIKCPLLLALFSRETGAKAPVLPAFPQAWGPSGLWWPFFRAERPLAAMINLAAAVMASK
jgi:hypothetical protein